MTNTDSYTNVLPVHKMMAVLSEILSEKYGCKVTIRAIPKDQAEAQAEQNIEVTEQKAG